MASPAAGFGVVPCEPTPTPAGEAGSPSGDAAKEQRRRHAFLTNVCRLLRLSGALVSLSFAFQGIWLFAHPHITDFWQFCHWVGQALLGVIAGFAGCYLEFKGRAATGHFTEFAINRVGSSIFYSWLGFYVMGGEGVEELWVEWLRHVTGIVSWSVALGDLMVSFTAEASPDDLPPCSPAASPAKGGENVAIGKATSINRLRALMEEGLQFGGQAHGTPGSPSVSLPSIDTGPAPGAAAAAGNNNPFSAT